MFIIKANGERVEFRQEKIRETLRRAGAKEPLIDRVMANVVKSMTDGMSTRKVFAIVRRELRKESRQIASRYNLRQGLLRLGPAGFKFEQYVAAILTAYQYEAEVPQDEFSGLCVKHEVDVIARRGNMSAVIEAKFRNRFDDVVNLKDTLATWARFLDLADGAKAGKCPRFDEAWIVTNGRFSERAMQFGVCKGMHMIGWSEREQSLARMVDHAALYPITVIDDLRQWELDKFAGKDIMLCRELADSDASAVARKVGLPVERVGQIVRTCKEIVTME